MGRKMAGLRAKDSQFHRLETGRLKRIGDDIAIYVPERRAIHVLNETAFFIWECLKEPVTFDELLFMLSEAFQGERKIMKKDLEEALDLLLKNGLVQRVE